MPRAFLVPAEHWRRGLVASERIGAWLHTWEERARCLREDGEPAPAKPAPPERAKSARK